MQPAGEETVLGDFDDATWTHHGVETRLTREGNGQGDTFVMRTEGADGDPRDYTVAYAFGVHPLQQYLTRFPDGRLQVLPASWDTRPAAEGGQRWFSAQGDERIPPGDPLHWTGLQYNWNHMCAACHATGLRKGYDAERDRFDTTWAEPDVACEACHGPGAAHVAAMRHTDRPADATHALPVSLPERTEWVFAEGAAIARPAAPPAASDELDTCAPCHARRGLLRERPPHGQPLADDHRLALLEEELYFDHGGIRDEVFVHGSFLQSRMHAAGVRCSDCHDPHSLGLRTGDAPDAVCGDCHRPAVFATPAHHHHEQDSPGASCVACHMPDRTYMGVDARRDHAFRVPRPDLTLAIGAPNACADCHGERTPAWAAEAALRWWGDTRADRPHWGEALAAARRHAAGAPEALLAVANDPDTPAIVRATALAELEPWVGPRSLESVAAALADPSPLVRTAALAALAGLEPQRRAGLALPLLRDPLLAVRLEAERVLRDVALSQLPAAERRALADVRDEMRAVQRLHADRPESWLALASMDLAEGDASRARERLERALALDPAFVPAAVNLADLLRHTGEEARGEHVLRAALARTPGSPALHEALGLLLVRRGRLDEATEVLRRAHERAPDAPRHALVYALALDAADRPDEATALLRRTHERFPGEVGVLFTLATRARDRGDTARARDWTRKLRTLDPEEAAFRALEDELSRDAAERSRPAPSPAPDADAEAAPVPEAG